MDSFSEVFSEVLKYCRNDDGVSEPGYDKWIKVLEPYKLENNTAYLLADSDFSMTTTMTAYGDVLKKAFSNVLGFDVDVKILVRSRSEKDGIEKDASQMLKTV